MTNQEKDLKNAREYLTEKFIETTVLFSNLQISFIEDFILKYPDWLEQKGVIQFTENRDKN